MRSQTTRTVSGQVNADGTIGRIGTGGFTSVKTSTGTYKVLLAPYLRMINAVAAGSAGGWIAFAPTGSSGFTANSMDVTTYGFSGAVADASFTFTAMVVA